MQTGRRQRAFTLLEILVMLVVIGITISFVTLSIGGGSKPVELQTEAEKVIGMLQLALEEAVLTGKPMGLRIAEVQERDGPKFFYEWSVMEQGVWQPLQQHPVLEDAASADGIELDLKLEGVEVDLLQDSKAMHKTAKKKQKDKDKGTDESSLQNDYQPDIYILQSGELTPFTLLISNPDVPGQVYTINGNPVGALQLLRPGEEDETFF